MEKWPSTQIKLCDFGLSRVLTNQRLLEMSGTTDFLGKFLLFKMKFIVRYRLVLAPEVVNYEPLTCATDMWNIGVLIYVLVTGHTPFGGSTKLDTQSNITHCVLDFPKDLFEKISEKCMDLIQKLIVRLSKYSSVLLCFSLLHLSLSRHRLTATNSLQHPWFHPNDQILSSNTLREEDSPNDNSNSPAN